MDKQKIDELQAELAVIRERLALLEAKQHGKPRRSPRGLRVGLLATVGSILLVSAVLYGQTLALFVANNGSVGIGTTSPVSKLHVHGDYSGDGTGGFALDAADDGNPEKYVLKIIPFVLGGNRVGYRFQTKSAGGGTNVPLTFDNAGNVGIGIDTPAEKMHVAGNVRIDGKVSSRGRYQRDNQSESTYEIPPPYHLSLTARTYGGTTETIPQDVLTSLCGAPGGCEVRLAMTRWSQDSETEAASKVFWFYYSAPDGHWRTSEDQVGVDGDGTIKHAKDAWGTCYFTDGTYSGYKETGDREKGMQLLVWNGYQNPGRTCELTLTK
jgi:hypothetical protein